MNWRGGRVHPAATRRRHPSPKSAVDPSQKYARTARSRASVTDERGRLAITSSDGGARMRRRGGGGASGHWKRVASSEGSGRDEFAMVSPLTATVGVPMPAAPGAMGVWSVIEVTYFLYRPSVMHAAEFVAPAVSAMSAICASVRPDEPSCGWLAYIACMKG